MKSKTINGIELKIQQVFKTPKSLIVVFTVLLLTGSCTIAYVPSYTPDVPVWAPPYNNVEKVQYYYLPDIECYYDVLNHEYVYRVENNWLFANTLPSSYDWYDLNNAFAIVIDVRVNEPWRHSEYYTVHYPRYYYRSRYKNYRDPNRILRGFDENEKKEIYRPHADQGNNYQTQNNYNGGQGYNNNHYNQNNYNQTNPQYPNGQQGNGYNNGGQNNGGQNQGNQQGQANPQHPNGQQGNGYNNGGQNNGGQNQGNQQGQTNPPHANGQPGNGQNQGGQNNGGQNQGNQQGQSNPPHTNGQSGGSPSDLPITEQPHPKNGGHPQGIKIDKAVLPEANNPELNPQNNAGQNQGGHNNQGHNQNNVPPTEQPHPTNGGHPPVLQTRPPVPIEYNNNVVGRPVKVKKEMLRPQPKNQLKD